MVEASGINYSIGSRFILKNINLRINDGEAVGIIGAPGSGKTLLLKILAGQVKNQTGSIVVDQNYIELLKKSQINKIISYFTRIIPENQDDSVFNFILSSRLPWTKLLNPFSETDRSIAEEAAANLNIIDYKNLKLSEISDTILLKTMIAAAFAKLSPFIVMDEPAAGLDIGSQADLSKSISKYLIDGSRCTIIASHDINFICRNTDKIYIMENGEIAMEISPYDLDAKIISRYFKAEVIISKNIYNGKPEVHLFPES